MRPGTIHALVVAAALIPRPAGALTPDETRHLLAHTGFGATPADVEAFRSLDRHAAVRKLLDGIRAEPLTPGPEWSLEAPPFERFKSMSDDERKQFQQERRQEGVALKGWWYQEMIATDSPLTERLTLFWSNHFTSSLQKDKWAPLLYRQNLLLRRNACGNFGTLLHEVARDPAMVIYLDNQTNRVGEPNENFARELMELFTLGEGNYSEQDIKESARAFTGWMADRRAGTFRFLPRQHDYGMKTFMGHSGRLDGNDIIDILLQQPRVAQFVTEKLWREFIGERPDPADVARLAGIFRVGRYEIRPLLEAMLESPAFWDPATRGTQVKSPVELVVGTVRLLDVPVRDGRLMARGGRALGQDVFDPPNVKGWPGGDAWIDSDTLLERHRILERVLAVHADAPPAHRRGERSPDVDDLPRAEMTRLVLATPPVKEPPASAAGPDLLRQLVLDPAYQLK